MNEIAEKDVINIENMIYEINGKIYFDSKPIFFDVNNTAIRGAILKNTKFIYGIIIYNECLIL